MAKTKEVANLVEMTIPDLQLQLRDCEEKLVRIKFSNSISPVKNPLEIRSLRRQRARILTYVRQKQLGQPAAEAPRPAAPKKLEKVPAKAPVKAPAKAKKSNKDKK